MKNKETVLEFSKRLESIWLANVHNYDIKKRTIVVNVGEKNALISTTPAKFLAPRISTILQDVTISSADSLVLIHIPDKINLGGITLDKGWSLWNHDDTGITSTVPLYMSPQFDVGFVSFDPFFVTGATDAPMKDKERKYQVKVNLWFSPEMTNCGIHNKHTIPERLEIHTQITGVGRMQKFHVQKFEAIYEDVILGAGMTHSTFAGVNDDGTFCYPWHQYFAETDCIWMSIEFHPFSST